MYSAIRSPVSSARLCLFTLEASLNSGHSTRYLGNEVLKLAEEGYAPLFAYEEAIGYLHGEVVRDKDGVS